jgi:hypothetical protein
VKTELGKGNHSTSASSPGSHPNKADKGSDIIQDGILVRRNSANGMAMIQEKSMKTQTA